MTTMLRNVLLKTLYDQWRSLTAWAVTFVLLVAMYVGMWPSIKAQPAMSDFLDRMPEAMRSLFAANGADMSTGTGYVQVELLSFVGPTLLLIYAIVAGSAAVAGEEDRHTLDMLLGNPVSRTRVVIDKLAAMVIGVVLLAAVAAAALLGVGSLARMDLPAGRVAAAMLHLALLGLVFGTLALAVGAVTGRPGASRAIPGGLAVLAYAVNGLAPMVSWLEPIRKWQPFYQYIGHDPLRHGVSVAGVVIALSTVAVLAVVAAVGFRRRDIAV